MPVLSGGFATNPHDQPGGYEGTFTVTPDPPGSGCDNMDLQVKVNVETGTVSVQGDTPQTDPNTGQPKTSGSSSSSNQQTTNPASGTPTTSPQQNQGGSSNTASGVTHNGQGQSSGTATAIQNANQQAGPTTDPQGNPDGGTSSTKWSVTITICYPGDPDECCYSITISGSNDGAGGYGAPTAT